MTARYISPSIEAILEDSEDESQSVLKGDRRDEDSLNEASRRHSRSERDSKMSPTKTPAGKQRERERSRKHKSTTSTSNGKHHSKSKSKGTNVKRVSGMSRDEPDAPRPRHRRTLSNQSTSSTSEEEENEPVPDHRAILAAARARLTSPSMVSTYTALTNSTNKSSGSSGSNSTVTQASITKRSSLVKRPEIDETPLSPAVPDAPNVFAFLEASPEEEVESEEDAKEPGQVQEEEEEEEDDEEEDGKAPAWPPTNLKSAYVAGSLPPRLSQNPASESSSGSSSHHSDDDSLSPVADNDTDRSTSPERSVKSHDSEHETPAEDHVSVKIASQMAAAQQRQNLYDSMQQFGTPNVHHDNSNLPHTLSSALSPRYSHHPNQRPFPRPEKPPVTGYELLASRLSSHNPDTEDGIRIKPIYRKFEALNHRLLLHLQDEISELEEQLRHIDHADTQSRRTERSVVPASRRIAAQMGGELEWHKTDVLGRIGYKLAQYNQALSSFNTTQSLSSPDPDDISTYRTYLQTENPIAEAETHFLDPTDDLVSIYSGNIPRSTPSLSHSPSSSSISFSRHHTQSIQSSYTSSPASPIEYKELELKEGSLPALATAVAVAVLVPILTFNVIPGFMGRLTVTALVALGVIGAMIQSGVVGSGCLLGREGMVCAGIYGGVMIVIAGIMG